MQHSEFGGEIAVDLQADTHFDESRSCPCHDVFLRTGDTPAQSRILRPGLDKVKSICFAWAIRIAYRHADAPPASVPRRTRAMRPFRQGSRRLRGQPAGAVD